jgi:hypothetical protein
MGISVKEGAQLYAAVIATPSIHGISTRRCQRGYSLSDTDKAFARPEHITVSQLIAGQPVPGSLWLMVSVLGLGLMVLIPLARLSLGGHSPADVLAGSGLGLALACRIVKKADSPGFSGKIPDH